MMVRKPKPKLNLKSKVASASVLSTKRFCVHCMTHTFLLYINDDTLKCEVCDHTQSAHPAGSTETVKSAKRNHYKG
jgi:hypothetical protein